MKRKTIHKQHPKWQLLFGLFLLLNLPGCGEADETPSEDREPDRGEFLDENTYRVNPKNGDNFDIAEFRLWLPPTEEVLRAVIVLLHSHNSNGLGLADSPEWQEFATAEGLALLSVHLKTVDPTTGYYSDAHEGSGQALLEALNALAERSNMSYVGELPFLFRGYSAGGLFSHSFSQFRPERVIAFANIRGGSLNETSSANKAIPALMFYGIYDLEQRNARILEIVQRKRAEGGNWGLVREKVDHYGGMELPDGLIREFFASALRKRLPDNGQVLQELQEDSGWLGNNETFEVYRFPDYPWPKAEASWLIDESFAHQWQAFQAESN